jgi:hypothetical protein
MELSIDQLTLKDILLYSPDSFQWGEPEVWHGHARVRESREAAIGALWLDGSDQSYPVPLLGSYVGDVIVQMLVHPGRDRHARVYRPFSYIDSTGREWPVPEGAIINGASIPRPLWSIIGSPFVGDYRRAAAVHDYYCTRGVRERYDYRAVHWMFRDGCRSDGLTPLWLYSRPVQWWGPRWPIEV